MKLVVYLRSGANFEVDVDDVKSQLNNVGQFTNLRWVTPSGWKTKLHEVVLSEIAALVIKR